MEPPQEVRFRGIFRDSIGVLIFPEQKLEVPDKNKLEADIVVPGVLRIKASNVYFPDLVLEYEYDIVPGRIIKIEGHL